MEVGSQYYIVWKTNDTSIDNIIWSVIGGYGFDSADNYWFILSSKLTEEQQADILYELSGEDFTMDEKFFQLWDYVFSYEVPVKL